MDLGETRVLQEEDRNRTRVQIATNQKHQWSLDVFYDACHPRIQVIQVVTVE
jgi:hypothetical protein